MLLAEVESYSTAQLRCGSGHEHFSFVLLKAVNDAGCRERVPVHHAHTQVLVLLHEQLPTPIQCFVLQASVCVSCQISSNMGKADIRNSENLAPIESLTNLSSAFEGNVTIYLF